jgi:hypothetical protein
MIHTHTHTHTLNIVEIAHDIYIYIYIYTHTILCIDMYIIVQFVIEISVCLLSYTCSLGLKGC